MSASASAQVAWQALNKVGELNPQCPLVSKINNNPDILLRKSQMDRLKGHFSISQVQPLNFSSVYFSASTVGSYLDFNQTNINEDIYRTTRTIEKEVNLALEKEHWCKLPEEEEDYIDIVNGQVRLK